MALRRLLHPPAIALAALALLAAPAAARDPERSSFDGRAGAIERVPGSAVDARADLRKRLGRQALLAVDDRTGAPRALARLDGFLTGPSSDPKPEVVEAYLRSHSDVFGLDAGDIDALSPVRSYRSVNGMVHITYAQTYEGIPSADTLLKANLTDSGRLINLLGPAAPDLAVPSTDPRLSAGAAYASARAAVGARGAAPSAGRTSGATRATPFADGGRASLAIYRSGAAHRLAWRLVVPKGPTEVYDMLVDASTGDVVRSTNLVKFATGEAFDHYPGAANGGTQTSRDFTGPGWLTAGATTLSGDNAHAGSDVNDVIPGPQLNNFSFPPADEVGPSGGGNWSYAFTPFTPVGGGCTPSAQCAWDHNIAGSWQTNRAQDATQLFYFVNNFHDHTKAAPIGFNEASGNFEQSNGANGGAGGDAVLAQGMDGANTASGLPDPAHRNNANMLTLPDGTPGLMQMYLVTPGNGLFRTISTADDATIVYHEYIHGLSNRLITDAAGFGALDSAQSGAMGEAWSDWYALDYLVGQGFDSDTAAAGDVKVGDYWDRDQNIIRTEALDCLPGSAAAQCPGKPGAGAGGYTYGDFGRILGRPEVHADGEIWAQTLWQLRQALVAAHPADGVARARRYITDAMRLSPDEPSFLDMRNAILQAGTNAGGGDESTIWSVFASRGMGYFASTEGGNDVRPVESFSMPPAPGGPTGTVAGNVKDEADANQPGTKVAFGGHDTGLGPELSATTNASGDYSIAGVPVGTYPLLYAKGPPGFPRERATSFAVAAGTNTRNFVLRRNFASGPGGAQIASFDGPDFSRSGCGPGGLIDDDQGTVWGTTVGAKQLTVRLSETIDIREIRIDPTAGCGDDANASLGQYAVEASADGVFFSQVAAGTFTAADLGRLNSVALSGTLSGRRFVRLRALAPQSSSGSGASFIDVSELQVLRGVTPIVTTEAATAIADTGATLNGSVNPRGRATTYHFEYGTSTSYGSQTADASAGGASSAQNVSGSVSGLLPGTTYHYRLVATSSEGTANGPDRTFTTSGTAPPPPGGGSGATPGGAGPPGGTGGTPGGGTPSPGGGAGGPPGGTTGSGTGRLATLSASRSPKVSRRGVFTVRARFAASAPARRGRLDVLRGRAGASDKRILPGLSDWLALARMSALERIGSGSFHVKPGRAVTIRVRLNRAGRKALNRRRRLTATLRLTVLDAGGRSQSQTKVVRLRRTR